VRAIHCEVRHGAHLYLRRRRAQAGSWFLPVSNRDACIDDLDDASHPWLRGGRSLIWPPAASGGGSAIGPATTSISHSQPAMQAKRKAAIASFQGSKKSGRGGTSSAFADCAALS